MIDVTFIRRQLVNMSTVTPVEYSGAVIRLHIQRGKYSVQRYYSVTCGKQTWKSPLFISPYSSHADLFYDGDPLAEQREAIQAVIRCLETQAWKKPAHVAKRIGCCGTCGKSLVGMRQGTNYCGESCREKAYRMGKKRTSAA